jgi:hypothetical protein
MSDNASDSIYEHDAATAKCFNCGRPPGKDDAEHTACECGQRAPEGWLCNRFICDECRLFRQGVFAWPPSLQGLDAMKSGKTYEQLEFTAGEILEVSKECYDEIVKHPLEQLASCAEETDDAMA